MAVVVEGFRGESAIVCGLFQIQIRRRAFGRLGPEAFGKAVGQNIGEAFGQLVNHFARHLGDFPEGLARSGLAYSGLPNGAGKKWARRGGEGGKIFLYFSLAFDVSFNLNGSDA